ncbi:MAG: hypothetical protein AB1631_28510 [Acidobacteriota bacterium]
MTTDVATTKNKQIETTKAFRVSLIDFSSRFLVPGFYCISSSSLFGQLFVSLPMQPILSVAEQLPSASAWQVTSGAFLHFAVQLSANEVKGVRSKKAEAKTRPVQTEILTETSIFFIDVHPPERVFPTSLSFEIGLRQGATLSFFFLRCQAVILIENGFDRI